MFMLGYLANKSNSSWMLGLTIERAKLKKKKKCVHEETNEYNAWFIYIYIYIILYVYTNVGKKYTYINLQLYYICL